MTERLIVFVSLIALLALALYQRSKRIGYSKPQPSSLTSDLTQQTPTLTPKVSGVAIQWNWWKSTSFGWPQTHAVFDLYDEGIVVGAAGSLTQLSYDDIEYVSKGPGNLYVFTKLKAPASMTISTKALDEIINVLTSKGVDLK